jgi:hypothetical protein
VAKSASVSTNDPHTPTFNLTLRARFKADQPVNPSVTKSLVRNLGPLRVEPTDRWTSSIIVGSSTATTLYLVNEQAAPIHVKQVVSDANFSAKFEPIQDGKRYQLNISSSPQLKPGRYHQTLRVVTDFAANPESTIDVDLTVYPKVFATPVSINMVPLPAASNLSGISWPVITVRKLREGGLQIKSFSSTLPFLKLELIKDLEGQVYRIRLILDPQKVVPGAYSGTIRIETNDADVPVLEIPVKGTFT